MDENIKLLAQKYHDQIAHANTSQMLEDLRVSALGKKGEITLLLKKLGGEAPEVRKQLGQVLNQVKSEVLQQFAQQKIILDEAEMNARLLTDKVDLTLPASPSPEGYLHPINQTLEEVMAIFADMGCAVAEGPDIEDDFHNFTALNMPAEHPARQMHDTFYLQGVDGEVDYNRILRTHTSNVQIRTMESQTPPIRVVAPGRTYRSDSDMTHTPMFSQIEGLVIDKSTNFAHLMGFLQDFVNAFFELDHVPLRFRPSYFPFTEPSAEVDIGCAIENNKLKIGAGDKWLEILGCGMVHSNVLKAVNLDPDHWQGFAFGVGIERITMLKYGITDLRTFFEGDMRWLKHYGFLPLDLSGFMGGKR